MDSIQTAFDIKGLRLLILSFYLDINKQDNNNYYCNQIYNKISNKFNSCIYNIIFKIFRLHGINSRI